MTTRRRLEPYLLSCSVLFVVVLSLVLLSRSSVGQSGVVPGRAPLVTHQITDGTMTVGINANWGGAITLLSFPVGGVRYRNVVNNEDGPGRQVEAALYNAFESTDCWPCNAPGCTWGWDPVQAGNACQQGSGGTVLEQTGTRLVTSTTPLQWNNLYPGGPTSRVTLRQTLELVQPWVLKMRYTFTNHESFPIGVGHAHELPVAYLIPLFSRALAYQGNAPWTGDANLTEFNVPCCRSDTGDFDTTEPWVAWVDNSTGTGAPLDRPALALYVPGKHSNWNMGTREVTSYMQNWVTMEVAPEQTGSVEAYLVAGPRLRDARSTIYQLALGSPPPTPPPTPAPTPTPTPPPTCGDGICDGTENCHTCRDCPCDSCSIVSCANLPTGYCNNRCGCACNLPYPPGGTQPICGSCP